MCGSGRAGSDIKCTFPFICSFWSTLSFTAFVYIRIDLHGCLKITSSVTCQQWAFNTATDTNSCYDLVREENVLVLFFEKKNVRFEGFARGRGGTLRSFAGR